MKKRAVSNFLFVVAAFVYAIAVHYGVDLAMATSILAFVLIFIIARELQRVDERIDKITGTDRD